MDSAVPAPLPPETAAPALSQGERLLYTFTAPSRTMADIRRSTSWWVPWLLISVFSIGFGVAVEKKIGWEQVRANQLESNPKMAEQMEKVPAEKRAQAEQFAIIGLRVTYYGFPLWMLLGFVINAGLMLLIFNFGFGTKLRFRDTLAVSVYSSLPGIVKSGLMILVVWLTVPDNFDINNPVATNPGYFIPASHMFLKVLLTSADIIVIWQMILMAIGVSRLSKVKVGTASAALLGCYFVIMFAIAGLASAFS